jgi:hypothetical protein
MWREWLAAQPWGHELTFAPPARDATLAAVEEQLGEPMPADLRALLLESDGVRGFELGVVWPSAEIAETNLRMRADPNLQDTNMSFEGLLFFAEAGNGDQFGFGRGAGPSVYAWDHEDDSRRWVASNLRNTSSAGLADH